MKCKYCYYEGPKPCPNGCDDAAFYNRMGVILLVLGIAGWVAICLLMVIK